MRIEESLSLSKPLSRKVHGSRPSLAASLEETVPSGAAENNTPLPVPVFPELIYTPYVYSCPGKSEVTFKGRRERNSGPLFTEVIYDSNKVPKVLGNRAEIKLPGISKSFITKARLVVEEIRNEWEKAEQLRLDFEGAQAAYKDELKRAIRPNVGVRGGKQKVRYIQTEEKDQLRKLCDAARDACRDHPFGSPYKKIETPSNESFIVVYEKVLEAMISSGELDPKLERDVSFKALVTFLCQKTNKNKNGFFQSMPTDFYKYEDPDLLEKVRTIGRYCLVNLKKIDTAKKIEEYNGFSKDSAGLGIQYLSNVLTFSDFLKVVFPGYLDGGNPPVREWVVSGTNKWQAEDSELYKVKLLATRAVKNVFEEQDVLNPDGTINEEKLLEVDWGTTYHNALKGAIGICPYTMTFFDAMELAVPGLFTQIPKFKFKYPGKWSGENGLKTIDEITRYVVEKKLKLLKSQGKLDVEFVRKIEDWSLQYNRQVHGCIKRSGLKNVYEALERVYPDSCGWGALKLDPADLQTEGKWDGEQGRRAFQLKLAKCIYLFFEKNEEEGRDGFDRHTVTYDPKQTYPLSMSKNDINLLLGYFLEKRYGWSDFISDNGLTAGLRDVASGSCEEAFKILFGKESKVNKKLGSSDITMDDLYSRSQNRSFLVSNMITIIPWEERQLELKIKGFGEQRGYRNSDMAVTGIEETCLEPLLEYASPSKIPERTQIVYDALAASILPFPTMDEGSSSRVKERCTVLEKLLVSAFPKVDPKNNEEKFRPVLPDPRLKVLLATVRDEIVPNLTIHDSLKDDLSKLITRLIALKNSSVNNCREVLLQACKATDVFELTPVNLLNATFEKLFESISAYEIRRSKIAGAFSPYFNNIYSTVQEESEDSLEVIEPEVEEKVEEEVAEVEEMVEVDLNVLDDDDDFISISDVPDEVIRETVEICSGLKKEDERIQELLLRYLKFGRVPILTLLEGGDFSIQMSLLAELRTRVNKRSQERFNFITLRLKEPKCKNVERILDEGLPDLIVLDSDDSAPELQVPSDSNVVDLESVLIGSGEIDVEKIDEELFGLIPPWWPMKDKEPLAVPLLYWGNILYVALPENREPNIVKAIQRRFPIADVKPIVQKSENWAVLSEYFKTHAQIYSRQDVTLLRPFISLKDQEILLENAACIRSSLASLVNKGY